ncbi:putative ABC transporter domain-containing protein [Seiridium cardinale]|uniref:ABC transporter domain-containing protein n=1 Tax=Seiridium cardinale TaxID=138064 RepID=A0ABR2XNB9_9PEZI
MILVPPTALPGFWTFMFHVSPQTYLMHGLVVAGLANTKIHCAPNELLHIDRLPSGISTCGEYLEAHVKSASGYAANPNATVDCMYRPVSGTNILARKVALKQKRD